MKNIIIFEDNINAEKFLIDQLTFLMKDLGIEAEIKSYPCWENYVKEGNPEPAVVFLDHELQGLEDGNEIKRNIEKLYQNFSNFIGISSQSRDYLSINFTELKNYVGKNGRSYLIKEGELDGILNRLKEIIQTSFQKEGEILKFQ